LNNKRGIKQIIPIANKKYGGLRAHLKVIKPDKPNTRLNIEFKSEICHAKFIFCFIPLYEIISINPINNIKRPTA